MTVSPLFGFYINTWIFGLRYTEQSALHGKAHGDHLIGSVHPYRRAGERSQLFGTPDVIEMRVRDENRFHLQRMFLKDFYDLRDVGAGIDDHSFASFRIAEDRAVALQHTHGKHFMNHSSLSYGLMDFVISFAARYLHIASAITLMGGLFFALLAWIPALQRTSGVGEQSISDAIAARFRPWFLVATLGLLLSGFYNYYRHVERKDVPSLYHMVFGMKFLLALHVFAVGFLALKANNPKRRRQILGVVISGLVIIALSGWMRQLHLSFLVHAAH